MFSSGRVNTQCFYDLMEIRKKVPVNSKVLFINLEIISILERTSVKISFNNRQCKWIMKCEVQPF